MALHLLYISSWVTQGDLCMLEWGKKKGKRSAPFWKCDSSRKEGYFKCCTSSALLGDMGMSISFNKYPYNYGLEASRLRLTSD